MNLKRQIHINKNIISKGVMSTFLFSFISFGLLAQEESDTHSFSDTTQTSLEEFVVTGQYQAQSLRNSVYKINVIDQKRIEAKSSNNAQQILTGELGIRFSNDMALGTADINIMGMSGRNIKILLDGVPMLDRGEIREALNQINASQIERIEVIEGPMSTIYGSDAQAGVINIITKKPDTKTIQLSAQIQEETAAKEYQVGHGKGMHLQQLSGGWDNGKLSILASVMHYDFGGWGGDSVNRNHTWMPKQQILPSIRLGYRGKDWDVLYRNDYIQEVLTSKSAINGAFKATNKFYTTNRMAHQLQYNHKLNQKLFWNTSLGYTDYKRYTKTDKIDYNNKTITPSDAIGEHDTARFEALNFRTSLLYTLNKKISIQPGIEYSFDKASGARITDTPSVSNFAGFVTAEYKPNAKLNIRPGLRFTYNSIYKAPPVIPSLNTMYKLNDNLSLRASYAHGYRAPALRELFFHFVDANHNIIGNPNLKAENSKSVNASIMYRKPIEIGRMYSTEFSFFYNDYTDMITMAQDPINPQRFTMLNIDKYRTMGLSLANRFVTEKVEWRLGGILLGQYNEISEIKDLKSEYGSFVWSPEVNLEIMYTILASKTKLNLFYKFNGRRLNYYATQNTDGSYDVSLNKISAFNLLDFNIQQQVVPNVKLVIGARNILNIVNLDRIGSSSGSAHSTTGPVPISYGRSFFASLNFNLNKQVK